jgi:hypothetical protein
MPAAADTSRARQLWDYLRLGIAVQPAECLLVFGGHDLGVAERAADLYLNEIAPLIVVSGGSRAVPDGSDFPTEADAIADVLQRRDVPKEAIALEPRPRTRPANVPGGAEALRVAVTSQAIGFDDYCAGDIPVGRIFSMLAGEALRLEAYAASGLIDLDEPVPADLLTAARARQEAGFNGRAVRPS